jgi:alpha-tubulin suppressor-like RCC1 family protein
MKRILNRFSIVLLIVLSSLHHITAQCWSTVSAGGNHTLAIKADGSLWSWGENRFFQLGDNTQTERVIPRQIGSGKTWKAIAAGYGFSLALKKDGSLWAWGANSYGQLGLGLTSLGFPISAIVPTQVGNSSDWAEIAVGDQFSLALKTDGTIWIWGNVYNIRNDGNLKGINAIPMMVDPANYWAAIAAGRTRAIAIHKNGTLWAWGGPPIGDGSSYGASGPVLIDTSKNWKSIHAGAVHSLAIKKDGSLWGWGNNIDGEVGDGTWKNKFRVVRIGLEYNWESISADEKKSLAIAKNGTLWAWGLGIGTGLQPGTSTNYPLQVGEETTWKYISAGTDHTMGIKTDGSLWGWGRNLEGQLGIGNKIGQIYPTLIGCTVTNLHEIEAEDFSIVPNPSTDQIRISGKIDGDILLIRITDLLGKTLKQKHIYDSQSIVDISALSKGIYFLIVELNDGKSVVKKIIKL